MFSLWKKIEQTFHTSFLSHVIVTWITKYATPIQWSKMEVSHSLSQLKPTSECRRLMFPSLLLLFSLQKIIRRNDGTESECTERDGWCLPKTSDDLRDTMSLMIKQIIRSTRPGKDASEYRSILLPSWRCWDVVGWMRMLQSALGQ